MASKKSDKGNDPDPETSKKDSASLESKSDPDMFDGVHKSILEAFDNLNWDDNSIPREQLKSYSRYWLPPEEKTESRALNLINSKLARFWTKEYTIPPLEKDEGKSMVFYLPGLKPNHQTLLPKFSVLTSKEQRQLYIFYSRMTLKNSRKPLDGNELVAFQELRTRVADEYAEFQEFAKSEWYKGQWTRVMQIPPQVEKFIDNLWLERVGQCLTHYPDEYKIAKHIPLSLYDPHGDNCVFEFVKHVQVQGFPLKMGVPKTKHRLPLISEFEDLCRIKPVTAGDTPLSSPPFLRTINTVSLDCNLEEILKRMDVDVDVVMSMSGMKTLVDNVKFQREWVLPIIVKDILKNDGETIKRIVIIDKNLPSKSLSVHDKNLWHAKIVAKWMLITANNPYLFEKKEDSPTFNKREGESYEELLSDVVEKLKSGKSSEKMEAKSTESEVETASCQPEAKPPLKSSSEPRNKEVLIAYNDLPSNVETPPDALNGCQQFFKTPQPRQIKKESCRKNVRKEGEAPQENNVNNRKRERQSLVSYDHPFTDFADQGQEEFGVNASAPKIARTEDKKCDEIKMERKISFSEKSVDGGPKKITESNEKEAVSSSQPLEEGEVDEFIDSLKLGISQAGMRRQCLQYEIWKIHKSKYVQFLKAEQRSLNVLVRTRRDGKLFHYENNIRKLEDVCVSSKLEFQPEYGASKMTASELIREYLDLSMRRNSKLVRVRSIGHTKEVMMTEVKTLAEIKTALQVDVCQIQRLYDPLYAVLTKLVDLPPGRYMLEHTAKMGSFATLFQESPGNTGFNLPIYCQELRKADVNVPPLPIDPLVLSPLQHRDRFPPALFIPKPVQTDNHPRTIYFSKPSPPTHSKTKKKKQKHKKAHKQKKIKEKPEKNCDSKRERELSFDSVDSFGIDNLLTSDL